MSKPIPPDNIIGCSWCGKPQCFCKTLYWLTFVVIILVCIIATATSIACCSSRHTIRQVYEKQRIDAHCATSDENRCTTLAYVLWMKTGTKNIKLVGFLVSREEFESVDIGDWHIPSNNSVMFGRYPIIGLSPTPINND